MGSPMWTIRSMGDGTNHMARDACSVSGTRAHWFVREGWKQPSVHRSKSRPMAAAQLSESHDGRPLSEAAEESEASRLHKGQADSGRDKEDRERKEREARERAEAKRKRAVAVAQTAHDRRLKATHYSSGDLLIEKIGVGSGPDQMQLVSLDAVNQQPIGLDMKLPVTFPDPPQRMIAIACGQRVLPDQCRQRGSQPG